MSINSIVTRGYGSWGAVTDLPTRGYSILTIQVSIAAFGTVFRPNRLGTINRSNRVGTAYRPNRVGTVQSDRQGD